MKGQKSKSDLPQDPSKKWSKIRILVKQSKKTTNNDQLVVIHTISNNKINVQLVVRKLSELDSLEQHLNTKYGGHVIPYIKADLFFQQNLEMQDLLPRIQEYLNDLIASPFCRGDEKLQEFIFEQSVYLPPQIAYDKVLTYAGEYSRKYLNTMFTRKEENLEQNPFVTQFMVQRKEFNEFKDNFGIVKSIIDNSVDQQENVEEFLSLLSEMSGILSFGVYPQMYITSREHTKLKQVDKLLNQAQQAFNRWEMVNESFREIQSDINKGLHEYHHLFKDTEKKLKNWTRSLTHEVTQIIDEAKLIIEKVTASYLESRNSEISKVIEAEQIKEAVYKIDQQSKLKNQIHQNGNKSQQGILQDPDNPLNTKQSQNHPINGQKEEALHCQKPYLTDQTSKQSNLEQGNSNYQTQITNEESYLQQNSTSQQQNLENGNDQLSEQKIVEQINSSQVHV